MNDHLGEVVTYRVVVLPGQTTGRYAPLFGGPSHDIHFVRRIWRRVGRTLVTLEGKYTTSGHWNGRRVVVDLVTGRSVKPEHEDRYSASYLQISFWRDASGFIRVGRQGADPSATGLLDLTELRKLAGMPV